LLFFSTQLCHQHAAKWLLLKPQWGWELLWKHLSQSQG
jgi:hypothetical protein